MDTEDLVKIKKALDKPNSYEACRAMEKLLLEMGYYLAVPHNKSTEELTSEG